MLSLILPRLICLICFICTFHPLLCVPLLIPALFEFQNKRKRFKGSVLSPISALSLGINSLTQHTLLQHIPSISKSRCSAQPMNETPKFVFCSQVSIFILCLATLSTKVYLFKDCFIVTFISPFCLISSRYN